MRIAIFENLANSAYIQAKAFRALGVEADLVLDPLDRYVMSDPRWEDLDLELPTDQLVDPVLPEHELPDWVRFRPGTLSGEQRPVPGRLQRIAALVGGALSEPGATRTALGRAGWRGARLAAERAWIVKTLSGYDCVVAYGMGPAWAALARVPCLAETWGGDITMAPFYDTGDWEGHGTVPLPGPEGELFAQAKLQRLGYDHAARILLTDPRFIPFAERLGHGEKSLPFGFLIDVEKYSPRPEPELREALLQGLGGPMVFVPARQDWYWKGSDRLLRGFAQAAAAHPGATLVCAGWGADLDRSRALVAELGIGDRVRMLPSAMSKERLRRHYCAADIVADQFTVGSYGGSALEAMGCECPLLIHLDADRFTGSFSPPPVMNVSEPDEIGRALTSLFEDDGLRSRLGREGRQWVATRHGTPLAERVIELCREVVGERAADHQLAAI